MRLAVFLGMIALTTVASAQQQSTWWHGSFVNADSTNTCDMNDTLVRFEKDAVLPWETGCEITLQTDIRDTLGVLLDLACSYPDSPDEGYTDRVALFELSNGNMMEYSRLSKRATELRRCPN